MSKEVTKFRGITVKSRVPGRLRLRLPREDEAQIVRGLLACREAGLITSLSVNTIIHSVLIIYDERAFSEREILARLLHVLDTGNAASPTPSEPLDEAGVEAGVRASFAVRSDLPGHLRLSHPSLRWNRVVQRSVRSGLMNLDGVRRYRVSPETSSILVSYAPERLSRQALINALIRFAAKGLAGSRSDGSATAEEESPFQLNRSALQISFATVTLGMAAAATAFPALGAIALAGTAVASLHTLVSGVLGLIRRRRPTVDTLDATAIAIGLVKRYTLPVAAMVWLLNLSETLLDATYRDSRELVTRFFGDRDQTVRCLIDGQLVERSISELDVGCVVVVLSGEQIPLDGVIIEGSGMVDQSVLTGEYAPVDRVVGEEVFARTCVIAGQLHVGVVRSGKDTYVAGLMRIVEQALEHRVQLQTRCEQFAEQMVIPTYLLGGAAQLLSGSSAMLAVLNADYGTGIRIAGPSAMLSSIAIAMDHGILVKNGSVLERLHEVDAIVFDKTGTLTEAIPAVRQVISLGRGWDEERLLMHIASAEQRFHHPIAKAILQEAKAWGLTLDALVRSDYQAGLGIEVRTEEGLLRVGSRRYMESLGLPIGPSELDLLNDIDARGSSCVFASFDDRIMGLVEFEATARPEASYVINNLREKRGIRELYLVSGDHAAATSQVAAQLGIDSYFSDVLPKDKVKYVQMLQGRGLRVAMVGDGSNDAAALSQADYGISLRGGADAAIDAADIVLMDGRLRNLELLLCISENLRDNVQTSFRMLVAFNSILILGALLGQFGLGTSVVMNNALNLMATLNGLQVQDRLAVRKGRRLAPAMEHGENRSV